MSSSPMLLVARKNGGKKARCWGPKPVDIRTSDFRRGHCQRRIWQDPVEPGSLHADVLKNGGQFSFPTCASAMGLLDWLQRPAARSLVAQGGSWRNHFFGLFDLDLVEDHAAFVKIHYFVRHDRCSFLLVWIVPGEPARASSLATAFSIARVLPRKRGPVTGRQRGLFSIS